jgi:hypothetical protein
VCARLGLGVFVESAHVFNFTIPNCFTSKAVNVANWYIYTAVLSISAGRNNKLTNSVFFFSFVWGGVQLGPLGAAATNRPIVPAPGDYEDGEIGGMIGRGNRSTRRKPAPVPLCLPQTPHTARTRTRAAAMGSQRLTA